MRDPKPENISGEKQVQHIVEHSVDWGHVALGLAGLYAVWKVAGLLEDGDDGANHQVPAERRGD